MNKPLGKIFATLVLLAVACAPAVRAAETPKPALTFAFAGYDNLSADLTTLDKIDSHLNLSGKFEGLLALATKGQGLAGLDKSRPWGVLVALGDSDEPIVEGYLPLTDLKKFIAAMPSPSGKALTPNGDGVYEIPGNGRTIYAKQRGKWAVLSDNQDTLASAPADPGEHFSDLTSKYLIGVRGSVQNVPAERREKFLAAIRGLAEFFLAAQGSNEEQQAIQRASAKQMFDQLEKLSKELDTLTIGLGMDAEKKSLYLDIETRAVEGSELATKFAEMKNAKSNFAGFQLPGAAMTIVGAGTTSDDDAARAKEMLENLKSSAAKELENNEALGDKRATAKELLNDAFEVLEKTIDLKKQDSGAAIVLEDGPAIVGGTIVADGGKLDATLKKLVKELSSDKPELGNLIKFDAEEYEGIKFHVATIPVPSQEAQQVFGETVQIVVGLNESRLYFGAGKNPIELLKKAIAASKESPDKPVSPLEMVISAEPIAKFIAKVTPERNPSDADAKATAGKIAKQLAKLPGEDHITLTMKPTENGGLLRLTIDPGVTKTVLELIAKASNASSLSSDEQ